MGDINLLQPTIGLITQELSNLFQTLQGDSDLDSLRQQSKEAEKESNSVEKRLQDSYVDRIDPKLDCILVISPSSHSSPVLIIQRKDSVLE